MKKLFLFVLISAMAVETLSAQHTRTFTQHDLLFEQGKELYNQRKYSASYRCLEEFLKTTAPTQAGQIQEAEYYMAASAFELREDKAPEKLNAYYEKYPNSPFADNIFLMAGTLDYEKNDYSKALASFKKIDPSHVNERDRTDLLFYKGYANLQLKKYNDALSYFKTLKGLDTRYNLSATYYCAYTQYSLGNYDDALGDFLKIENNPAYSDIVPYYIIQIYYAKKDYDQVYTRAEELLKNNPGNENNAEIYRILGEISYQNKKYGKAIEYLKNYERIFPQVLRNDMYLLGLSYYETGDYANAIKYLSKVTTKPDEITENTYLHLGNSYIKLNEKANARLSYEAALKTKFNSSVREEAMFNYALTCYESTTAFGESVKAFDQFLTEFPDSKHTDQAYDYLTSMYLTTKNYSAAYQSILKIKSSSPRLTEIKQYLLYQMGTETFMQNDLAKSIDYFGQGAEISPDGKYTSECLFWRAECYYRAKQNEESINDLNEFFKNPNSKNSTNRIIAQYNLGYSYFANKQYDKAQYWFQRYVDAETNRKTTTYSDALNRIGDCYFSNRNFEMAEDYYSKAETANPSKSDYALFQAAYVAGLSKNYQSKISKLEKLIAMYPKSEYADDAYYEMGRSYLMMNNDTKAIDAFRQLIAKYPNSVNARKAALETGLEYFNNKDYNNAITSFKYVIEKYPGSEEASTALESLETVYIESNNVSDYMAYTKKLGLNTAGNGIAREDSLTYIAAEKQYINDNLSKAIAGFKAYLAKFCPGGKYCLQAQNYLADSYYRTDDKVNALASYQDLLKKTPNIYAEDAALRAAGIAYDQKNYAAALDYFKQLQTLSPSTVNQDVAKLGVLRCSYFLNDNATTIQIAGDILSETRPDANVKSEARYNRAKALLATGKNDEAATDLKILSEDTRTAFGSEAKYLLADVYFKTNKANEAEKEVLDFAKKNTPYPYWLARSFVLLADIYVKRGDDFQAKQYLLSLQKNYTTADDIQTMINDRLTAISQREKQKIIN